MKSFDDFEFRDWIKLVGISVLGLFFIIILLGGFFCVDAGEVKVTFNSITGVTQSYNQGMYLKIPLIESTTNFDVKTQKEEIVSDAASMDLQKVIVTSVINYHLAYESVNNLYVRIGKDYVEKIIIPAVNEAIKASTAQFPVEQIIVKREKLKEAVEQLLQKRLQENFIVLEEVNLVNIAFDEEFNKVVEEKQIEEQKIKTAEYKRRQAEENKKTTILEAEAEAQKQALLRINTDKNVIALKYIEKWDGKLPVYMLGDKSIMMLNGINGSN